MWCSVSGAAQEERRIANAARKRCRARISIFPKEFLPTIKSEEFLCSCGRCASDFFQRNSTGARDLFRDQPGISGFAPFPAVGNRREIRAICFNHEAIEGNLGCHVAHLFSVLECNDAGERNEMTKVEHFVGLLERAAETMKNAAKLAAVIAQNRERILPRV